MNVYIVFQGEYQQEGEPEIRGIFSNKEKANAFAEKLMEENKDDWRQEGKDWLCDSDEIWISIEKHEVK